MKPSRTRFFAALICLATLTSCSALPGIPDTEVAVFGPSVARVRSLLEEDRVREALDEAIYLTRRYPSGLTETLVGESMWRNGHVTEAEAHFRRAAKTDLTEAFVGLAAVYASAGHWNQALELLSQVSGSSEADAWAQPLLAGAAWRAGDADATRQHLLAWSGSEPRVELAHTAAASAAAIADLEGPPMQWGDKAVAIDLDGYEGGGWVVPVRVGGAEGRLLFDLAARQSSISPELAAAAGLTVRSGDGLVPPARSQPAAGVNRHHPEPLQVACPLLQVGEAELRNAVLGVGQPPDGVDGVLAFDLLSPARWSLRLDGPVLAIGSTRVVEDVHRMIGGSIPATVAWLSARTVRRGLSLQVFVYPRVAGERVAMGVDLRRSSTLDEGHELGSSSRNGNLQMGGWHGEVSWETASLEDWASAGGVAPTATLGHNLIAGWILHWYPEHEQFRFDRATAADSPVGNTGRASSVR